MRITSIIFLIYVVFIVAASSFGETLAGFMITDTKLSVVESEGQGSLYISSRVRHPKGIVYIDRMAATIFYGNRITTLPQLYDDGTHGDKTPGDGIFTLKIDSYVDPGQYKVVVNSVDRDQIEIESEPMYFVIK
jgi:hypothetical protein